MPTFSSFDSVLTFVGALGFNAEADGEILGGFCFRGGFFTGGGTSFGSVVFLAGGATTLGEPDDGAAEALPGSPVTGLALASGASSFAEPADGACTEQDNDGASLCHGAALCISTGPAAASTVT